MNIRQKNWGYAKDMTFDVAIIGGGINGASIYKNLYHKGYKVILIDRGDFSCGTSQASAMMIWGGLLYLRNFDLKSVYAFSKDRDSMIKNYPDQISTQKFRYIPSAGNGPSRHLIYLGLHLYWVLGGFKRVRPTYEKQFTDSNFLKNGNQMGSLSYEEGFLQYSDSQFVLDWITRCQSQTTMALNYCEIEAGEYRDKDGYWVFHLRDTLGLHQINIKTRLVLNCAGVWTDEVNDEFGIESPYKHVLSKGVFIGYKKPAEHQVPLIFEMGEHNDVLSCIPWGSVSLWGPTDTLSKSIEEGFQIFPEDVRFLLKHARKNLALSMADSPIISLRCGIRPLAIKRDFTGDFYPLDVSRHHKIVKDSGLPWISIYGGKISGCLSLSEEVAQLISRILSLPAEVAPCESHSEKRDNRGTFPGLNGRVPTIDWCIEHEFCSTLEDYLRRRTNISQWVPREGLGFNNENLAYIKDLASKLPTYQQTPGTDIVEDYLRRVHERFDHVIEEI